MTLSVFHVTSVAVEWMTRTSDLGNAKRFVQETAIGVLQHRYSVIDISKSLEHAFTQQWTFHLDDPSTLENPLDHGTGRCCREILVRFSQSATALWERLNPSAEVTAFIGKANQFHRRHRWIGQRLVELPRFPTLVQSLDEMVGQVPQGYFMRSHLGQGLGQSVRELDDAFDSLRNLASDIKALRLQILERRLVLGTAAVMAVGILILFASR